ncbi:hypothetical protein B6N31_08095 [Dickeya fangzhongdai]|uniref:TetR/AcrR family transcriptional regulator n=1 Tax=Dickeya fangzhongdai TaxID=1778540 RepID=UPI000EB069E6|nr:TetR/AcrR family transcriptional regulator [Dickeya fangzhongdai]AYH47645.1 hypothetical protein B6N31_08095 [Dickeya fangzhongdai]
MPQETLSERSEHAATGRKTQPRGRRSARKLLDTAMALFAAKGVEATTVDEIVDVAGLSKGTFYHHYDSKSALLDALRAEFIRRFHEHINGALARCAKEDYASQLESWVRAAIESYLELGELHAIVFSGADYLLWSASDEAFMGEFIAILEQGHRAGAWRVTDAHLTATFILRGLLGVIDDRLLSGQDALSAWPTVAALVATLVGLPGQVESRPE